MPPQKPKEGFSLADLRPDLLDSWDYTRNELGPDCYGRGSDFKVWWRCSEPHSWLASVSNRVAGKGCSYCSGQKVLLGYNDLSSCNPSLASQWSPRNTENPSSVTSSSNRKVEWVCENNHTWIASVNDRSSGKGCPRCRDVRFGLRRSSPTQGESLLDINPELSLEWSDRNKFSPNSVKAMSHKIVLWVCHVGHEWESSIANRSLGNGCPYCANNRGSETNMVNILHLIFGQNVGPVVPLRWDSGRGFRVDYLTPYNLVFEYDGGWHTRPESFIRDTYKTQTLLDAGYTVVRLRQIPLSFLDLSHPNFLQVPVKWDKEGKDIKRVIDEVVVPWVGNLDIVA